MANTSQPYPNMSSTEAINYATFFGFDSVAAAAVFAALYTLLFCFFLFRVLKQRRWILISLLVFCACKEYFLPTCFLKLIGHFSSSDYRFYHACCGNKDGQRWREFGICRRDGNIVLSRFFRSAFLRIYFGCGKVSYFPKLPFTSFLTLIFYRYELCQTEQSSNPLVKNFLAITRNSRIFRIVMTVPIGLSIAGLDESVEHPEESIGLTLRKVSAAVFLVLTIFQLIQTLLLIKTEHDGRNISLILNRSMHGSCALLDKRSLKYTSSTFGARHASVVFGAISLLLLIRGVFSLATVGNTKANNEHFWYPLVAVPEILCVFLYLIPGVVPPKVVPRDMESLPMDPK